MPTYIGVLRAINLGSHNKIAMSDLRAMMREDRPRGAKDADAERQRRVQEPSGSADKVEQLLEDASTKHLGVTTDYFVRSAKEWQAIIDANPFPKEAKNDPARLVMMCLRDAPSRGAGQGAAGGHQGPGDRAAPEASRRTSFILTARAARS